MPYADPRKERENQWWHALTCWIKRMERRTSPKCSPGYRQMLLADPCAYCGEPGGTVDHIEPSIESWDNLTGACQSCNSSKHTTPLLAFLAVKPLTDHQVAIERERRKWLALGPKRSIRTVSTRARLRNAA